jgi:hypothetical protein
MRSSLFVLAGSAVLMAASQGYAKVEADPQKEYPIAPDAGPWMICVKSYMGEMAPRFARDLVYELRSRYDLPAYVFNRGDEERRKLQAELEKQRREQEVPLLSLQQNTNLAGAPVSGPLGPRVPRVRIEDQCAVLIGGYKNMEEASKALQKIKKLDPPKSVPADNLLVASPDASNPARRSVKAAPMNPFAASFVVPNPTIPQEKPAEPRGVDSYDFLKKINAGESFSLLKCGKPWTLAIKEFRGAAIIQQKSAPTTFMEKLFGYAGDQLSASALNAHNMAECLNKIGFHAYVLHTRTSSIVCVGAYDKPDDHALQTDRQALLNRLQFSAPDAGGINSADLMAQPLPMPVPQPDNSHFKYFLTGRAN